jgi:hypothetical protein
MNDLVNESSTGGSLSTRLRQNVRCRKDKTAKDADALKEIINVFYPSIFKVVSLSLNFFMSES